MDAKALSFQKNKALAIVQLSTDNRNTFKYISGDEALKGNKIEVTEINEAGSVNRIRVLNHSGDFVFFMDGDILIGAKQNRVLNTSVLLFPESKTNIPVSCVEAGRWRYSGRKFSGSEFDIPAKMRSSKAHEVKKNLESRNVYEANQGIVWDQVSNYEKEYACFSGTSSLSDLFNSRRENFDEFIKNFKCDEDANCMAVFMKNKLLSLDIFNRTDIFRSYFPRILRSAAMEACRLKDPDKPVEEAEAKYKTLDFFDKFETMKFDTHKGVSAGEEKRFETEEITGFELSYSGNLIHLTALNLK